MGSERRPGGQSKAGIFLVDDFELIQLALEQAVRGEADLDWRGSASTAAMARESVPHKDPDVVVIELNLPDGSGLDVCRVLASSPSHFNCLMMAAGADQQTVLDSFDAGATGFWLKTGTVAAFLNALRAVVDGRVILHPALTAGVLAALRSEELHDVLESLTASELTILKLLARGLTNSQIARQSGLKEQSIKNRLSSVYRKLGVENRTQAALQYRLSLLHASE